MHCCTGSEHTKKERKKGERESERAVVCLSADSEESGEKLRFYGQRIEGVSQSAKREKRFSKTRAERGGEQKERQDKMSCASIEYDIDLVKQR